MPGRREEKTALATIILVILVLAGDLLAWLRLGRQVRDLREARLGRYLRLTDPEEAADGPGQAREAEQ